ASHAQGSQGVINDPIEQNMRITAVGAVTNADGTVQSVVAASENALSRSQKASLNSNEVAVSGSGHAEATILNSAKQKGQTVTAVAPSRPACTNCQQMMQQNNVKIIPPKKPGD